MVRDGGDPLAEWLDRLAAPHGDPGGGAAGDVALAMAAALCEMVAGYPAARPADAAALADLRARVTRRRARALELAGQDGDASALFTAASRIADDAERAAAMAAASMTALESAVAILPEAIALVDDLEELEVKGTPRLLSDVSIAAAFTRAALWSARTNIAVDLAALDADHRHANAARLAEAAAMLDASATAIARLDAIGDRLNDQLGVTR